MRILYTRYIIIILCKYSLRSVIYSHAVTAIIQQLNIILYGEYVESGGKKSFKSRNGFKRNSYWMTEKNARVYKCKKKKKK